MSEFVVDLVGRCDGLGDLGAQTVAELRTRTERLHRFADTAELETVLEELAVRELAERLPRRPGEREEGWTQRLGGGEEAVAVADAAPPSAVEERLAALEARVAALEGRL